MHHAWQDYYFARTSYGEPSALASSARRSKCSELLLLARNSSSLTPSASPALPWRTSHATGSSCPALATPPAPAAYYLLPAHSPRPEIRNQETGNGKLGSLFWSDICAQLCGRKSISSDRGQPRDPARKAHGAETGARKSRSQPTPSIAQSAIRM